MVLLSGSARRRCISASTTEVCHIAATSCAIGSQACMTIHTARASMVDSLKRPGHEERPCEAHHAAAGRGCFSLPQQRWTCTSWEGSSCRAARSPRYPYPCCAYDPWWLVVCINGTRTTSLTWQEKMRPHRKREASTRRRAMNVGMQCFSQGSRPEAPEVTHGPCSTSSAHGAVWQGSSEATCSMR